MFCVMIYSFVISLHPRFKQFWPPRARRAACAAAGTHGLCALVAPDALLSLCSWWFVVGPQQRLHGGCAGRWRILPWYTGVCGHPPFPHALERQGGNRCTVGVQGGEMLRLCEGTPGIAYSS